MCQFQSHLHHLSFYLQMIIDFKKHKSFSEIVILAIVFFCLMLYFANVYFIFFIL